VGSFISKPDCDAVKEVQEDAHFSRNYKAHLKRHGFPTSDPAVFDAYFKSSAEGSVHSLSCT
jgi:hypothetical protein